MELISHIATKFTSLRPPPISAINPALTMFTSQYFYSFVPFVSQRINFYLTRQAGSISGQSCCIFPNNSASESLPLE
jgi:hypothetical protein